MPTVMAEETASLLPVEVRFDEGVAAPSPSRLRPHLAVAGALALAAAAGAAFVALGPAKSTAGLAQGGGSGDFLEAYPQTALASGTLTCLQSTLMGMTTDQVEEALRGKGTNPATGCGVAPGDGFYTGIQGQDAPLHNKGMSPLEVNETKLPWRRLAGQSLSSEWSRFWDFSWMWRGKWLKECTEFASDKTTCVARNLTNQLTWPLPYCEFESFHGAWTIKKVSRIDGKPAAAILYAKEMPQALDELRPWCACGVRVFLGMLYWQSKGEDNFRPMRSFLLIPPGTSENNCPSPGNKQMMCTAGPDVPLLTLSSHALL